MTRLLLDDYGPGSRESIQEYIETVLIQRTTVNDDTSAERLAHNMTISILHRLGIEDWT